MRLLSISMVPFAASRLPILQCPIVRRWKSSFCPKFLTLSAWLANCTHIESWETNMAETKVIMPQMGESIFEGTITKWLKKKGERVERDEPLFEISTDKIDSEIPAPASGVVQDILVKEGQTVQINTVVAVIGDGGSKPAETKTEA